MAQQSATAQIIDDSTKVLYSPKTTLQLFEQDVLEGRYLEQRIDTSLQNMHNERYWYQDSAYYQHLGNVGTAAQPLFYRMPQKIGVRLGKNIFDRYAYDPQNINYYNTRSPYTHLYYVQGGQGEQVFEGIHARNISPNWNVGLAYRIISTEKQFSARSNLTNGLISNHAVKVFTHYRSKNDKYDLFANFTSMKAEQIEQGGIIPESADATPESLFDYDDYETIPAFLEQASNDEGRNNFHLMHIYKLVGEDLKFYHTLDLHRQSNTYQDAAIPYETDADGRSSLLFYPRTIYNSSQTMDSTIYKETQNVIGVTGNNKLSFYKAFIKYRSANINYRTNYRFASEDTTSAAAVYNSKDYNQLFVGGQLRLFYENKAELKVEGEFQISTDYWVKGTARLGGLQGSLERVLISPTVTQSYMLSNHYVWENDFNNSVTDNIAASYAGKIGGRQFVKLSGHYTNIKRYIYYNEEQVPEQLSRNQRFWGAEISHHVRFGAFHLENYVKYTNTDEADKVRMPEFLVDSKLYFQGALFKDALYGQLGVQATMPTGYYADAYMPVTQQFYVQDNFETNTYPVIDLFVTVDIKNLNAFLSMRHFNYDLWEPGYFSTPYYPGMRRSFTFGIKWMFFD
nr:putative porin [Pontibacter silvestris]